MSASEPIGQGINSLLGQELFQSRHIGPNADEERQMLGSLGVDSRQALIDQTIPQPLRLTSSPALCDPADETAALEELADIAALNETWRSYIGCGYHGTITPEPIRRNVLENPGWYTAYTPYQAEVAQGRLEALLNFQQMTIDLMGLPIANASLLDEATAAAEAMAMCRRASRNKTQRFLVDTAVHPQVLAVLRTRAHWMGIELQELDTDTLASDFDAATVFGAYLQTPDTEGRVRDFSPLIARHSGRWRARLRRHGSAGRHALAITRCHGRGYRSWLCPALWRADGIRRAACCVHGRRGQARSHDARPGHRRVERRCRQTGLPDGAANP